MSKVTILSGTAWEQSVDSRLSTIILNAILTKQPGLLKKYAETFTEDMTTVLNDKVFFEAIGENESMYILAHAIQFFLKGTPALSEDAPALSEAGKEHLERLVEIRNTHIGFTGEMSFPDFPPELFAVRWEKDGEHIQMLVNFEMPLWGIHYTVNGEEQIFQVHL